RRRHFPDGAVPGLASRGDSGVFEKENGLRGATELKETGPGCSSGCSSKPNKFCGKRPFGADGDGALAGRGEGLRSLSKGLIVLTTQRIAASGFETPPLQWQDQFYPE
ncbi:hypothetical protein Q9233_006638, partial [Columba guinea]